MEHHESHKHHFISRKIFQSIGCNFRKLKNMAISNKHFTPTRWTCYGLSLLITLAIIAVVVVVVIADNNSNRAEIREGYEKHSKFIQSNPNFLFCLQCCVAL